MERRWIETVEAQLPADPSTVSRRGLKATADGLYEAALNSLEQARRRVSELEALL